MMTQELVKKVAHEARPEEELKIGQWFWVTSENYKHEKETWLGCVTHIGSNYARLTAVGEGYSRVHFDKFAALCVPEPDAERIIAEQVERYRVNAERLMLEVREITRQLAISPRQELTDGAAETQALALRSDAGRPVEDYKQALVKAKTETLPALFEKIKRANERMANWMKAPLLAMKAELNQLKPAIELIEKRIFSVELYAGLVEQVEQIADGEPAAITEPIHLFQRRAYMDEECLAEYRTGGMEFKNLSEFDAWLVEPDNLARLLPFPRCALAFQVRRNEKKREFPNLAAWINFKLSGIEHLDLMTFLYMRNGERVYRLNTAIQFGAKLFPDLDRSMLNGKIYAIMFGDRPDKLIGEGEYLAIMAEFREYEKKLKKTKESERFWVHTPRHHGREFHEWTPDSIYYDDISKVIQDQIDEHNRLVLVLQGLLDRSPVFHPHPPWHLWEPDQFAQAFELIYDDSRAMTTGDAPDFEAYRARLNQTLKPGSFTVGQEDAWERREAVRENNRRAHDYNRSSWETPNLTTYRPYGDPGPGEIARVVRVNRKGECLFVWGRKPRRYNYERPDATVPCKMWVPAAELLNVDAYRPGDFKQFFKDPRTRADYLKWAPMLLAAEEWHAGKGVDRKKQ